MIISYQTKRNSIIVKRKRCLQIKEKSRLEGNELI